MSFGWALGGLGLSSALEIPMPQAMAPAVKVPADLGLGAPAFLAGPRYPAQKGASGPPETPPARVIWQAHRGGAWKALCWGDRLGGGDARLG